MRAPEILYHGPVRDADGRIAGWPHQHAVIVALDPMGADRPPELRAADALVAAGRYCAPGAPDEPTHDDARHPVACTPLAHPRRDSWRVILATEPRPCSA